MYLVSLEWHWLESLLGFICLVAQTLTTPSESRYWMNGCIEEVGSVWCGGRGMGQGMISGW